VYQEIIDKMFLDKYEDRPPDGYFHPSSVSGCDRQAVYEVSGTDRTDLPDVRNIRIMGTGTDMHERIQDRLVQAHPGTLIEVKVEWEQIRGSVDAIVPIGDGYPYNYGHPEDDVDVLMPVYELQEFKSGGNWKMREAQKGPDPQHVKQARIYYAGLDHMGFLMDGIRIVYFGREDWQVIEHEVEPWTDEQVVTFLASLDNMLLHVEEWSLPDRLPLDSKGNRFWLCRYCNFRSRCWDLDGDNTRG